MASQTPKNPVELESVYDFTIKDVMGNDVVLVFLEYRLEIPAFPCNQIGEEERGTNDQIADFICTGFKSEFPIFDKIDGNGKNASPLYKFLKLGKWGFLVMIFSGTSPSSLSTRMAKLSIVTTTQLHLSVLRYKGFKTIEDLKKKMFGCYVLFYIKSCEICLAEYVKYET